MKNQKQLIVGLALGFFVSLAIAAMPTRFNPTQFEGTGGFLSHTNGGNLGTNMVVFESLIATNTSTGLYVKMSPLGGLTLSVNNSGSDVFTVSQDGNITGGTALLAGGLFEVNANGDVITQGALDVAGNIRTSGDIIIDSTISRAVTFRSNNVDLITFLNDTSDQFLHLRPQAFDVSFRFSVLDGSLHLNKDTVWRGSGDNTNAIIKPDGSAFFNNTVTATNGTSLNPGYNFKNDVNTGFYQPAFAEIGVTLGGSPRWIWNLSGHFVPAVNNQFDVGLAATRVRNVFSVDGNFSGEVNVGSGAILLNTDGSIIADSLTVNGLTSGVTTVAELSITQSVSMNDNVAGTLVLSTNVIGRTYRVQTTDTTGTILAAIPLPSESAVTMTVDITAAQSDYSNVNGYSFITTGKNNSGTSAMVGVETQLHEVEDQVSWNAQTAVDDATDTIRVLVQGAAATTVNWSCTVRLTWIK